MSAGSTSVRTGRFYTSARRHPWVLGKVADWKIPLGPYTPAQIAVAVGGGFLLVKTIGLWSWMGPVPPAAWLLGIWAVRRTTVRGRAPVQAALGWVLLGWQPRGGRIGGRAARDRAPHPFLGGFTIEDPPGAEPAAPPSRGAQRRPGPARAPRPAAPRPAAARPSPRLRTKPTAPGAAVGPVSGVRQLLALAERGGGVR